MTSQRGSETLLTDGASVEAFWRRDVGRQEELRDVEFLTGGVSSIVIRVTTDADAFVIKQALPQLRVEAAWYARPERSLIEARCATVLSDLVPGAVPEVIATVPSRNAFVMRSAPPGTETWKVRLMRGDVSIAMATTVGQLLGRIHARSAERLDISRDFADRSFFDELRIDPYLRYVAARTPALAPRPRRRRGGPSHDRGVPGPWRFQPEESARHARQSSPARRPRGCPLGASGVRCRVRGEPPLSQGDPVRGCRTCRRVSRRRRRCVGRLRRGGRRASVGSWAVRGAGDGRASARAGRRQVSGRVPDRRIGSGDGPRARR